MMQLMVFIHSDEMVQMQFKLMELQATSPSTKIQAQLQNYFGMQVLKVLGLVLLVLLKNYTYLLLFLKYKYKTLMELINMVSFTIQQEQQQF